MRKIKNLFFPTLENNYFPHFLRPRFLSYYFLVLLFLKISLLPILFFATKSPFFAEISKYFLLELVNEERKKIGLSLLTSNSSLEKSAYLKAKDILEKNYFSHYSPDGHSPWYWFKVAGYDYQNAGENLAIGFLDTKEVHSALMNSPSHRQNILNPRYREIGIAVLRGKFEGNEVYVVVQHFGSSKEKTLSLQAPASLPQAPTSSTFTQPIERATQTEKVVQGEASKEEPLSQPSTPTLILSASPTEETPEATTSKFSFSQISRRATKFAALEYNSLLNKIIYLSLFFLLFSLTLTIFYDIFIYRKFVLDYKQLIPSLIAFCLLLVGFLYLDQSKIILLIPHKLQVYGI